jgi:D-arabinose 1-dehydrogenase-like Zn-dependent alcohol dehydrogenase
MKRESMQALWLEDRSLSMRELPRPARPGEALIRIQLSGICAKDLRSVYFNHPINYAHDRSENLAGA